MRKVIIASLICLLSLTVFAQKSEKILQLPNGTKCLETVQGKGLQAIEDKMIIFDLTGYLVPKEKLSEKELFADWSKDTSKIKFLDTKASGQEVRKKLFDNTLNPAIDSLVLGMKVGSCKTAVLPYAVFSEEISQGMLPDSTNIKLVIELKDVKDIKLVKKWDVKEDQFTTTPTGLKVAIVKEGAGENPKEGDTVTVHYSGYLLDGKVFDSSIERDDPIKFVLGAHQVISGWDEGIALLKKGSKAQLIIPANLAYGERGAGGVIPPNATLVFDVELVAINGK